MNSLSRIFSKNDFESRSEWFDFHLRRILYLPWSIRFNFHYLPFRQAIRLPFMCFMRPTFAKLQGRVVLDCPAIRRGMVQFGRHIAPFPPKSFRWENQGTVVFKGRCILCDHSYISCGKDAYLEFGDRFSAGSGCRIACDYKTSFKKEKTIIGGNPAQLIDEGYQRDDC